MTQFLLSNLVYWMQAMFSSALPEDRPCSLRYRGVSSVLPHSRENEMSTALFSRRDFSRTVGQSLALAVAAPHLLTPNAKDREPASSPAASGVIRISANENPYGPSPKAIAAMAASGGIAARYPDVAHWQMCDALAKFHGVTRDNIVLGCGSGEILRVADVAFLAPGLNAVAAEPTFESVLEYSRVMRADAVKIPLTADHRHDLPRMAAACTSKTGLVYVCNPNNPTGTIVSRAEMADFIPRVPATALILVDEAYFHFVEDPGYDTALGWIGEHPNVVVVRTFSKVYGMAGMRLGYAVGAKETIARMRPHLLYSNANATVLAAAETSLGDTEYVASCRQRINGTRQWLADQLAKDGWQVVPSHTNFVMIDMTRDVQPIIESFRERNIDVGRRFPSMSNFLRVTIGTQPEMEKFLVAFREIAAQGSSKAA
jgi:histidinol-phosphate aminotransferase